MTILAKRGGSPYLEREREKQRTAREFSPKQPKNLILTDPLSLSHINHKSAAIIQRSPRYVCAHHFSRLSFRNRNISRLTFRPRATCITRAPRWNSRENKSRYYSTTITTRAFRKCMYYGSRCARFKTSETHAYLYTRTETIIKT